MVSGPKLWRNLRPVSPLVVWREEKDFSGVRPTCMGLGRSSQHMSHRGVGGQVNLRFFHTHVHACAQTSAALSA